MTRLALGTVQFGLNYGIANKSGRVSSSEAKTMLNLAASNGINTLDTAIAYGDSEMCLGSIGAQEFRLITKLPAIPMECSDTNDWVLEQVTASFSRLGVQEVYGLLMHRPEQLHGPRGDELYRAMQELKSNGRVQKIGVSISDPSELEAIIKLYRLDLVQAPFSLVDRRLLTTGWMQRLQDNHIEIHTRSTFLQGLLLMRQSAIPSKFARWTALWERWHNWLTEHQVSAVQACLAFPLAFPAIDRVVVGADSVDQLTEIVEAAIGAQPVDWPKLQCEDEDLINPSRWTKL